MSEPQTSQVTFIVRFWADESMEAPAWRGVAEQIGGQRQCAFQTMGELGDWLRLALRQLELARHDWNVPEGCESEACCGNGTDG
jgi:hypothetical protein